jgi:predicted glutamine amidotransferase
MDASQEHVRGARALDARTGRKAMTPTIEEGRKAGHGVTKVCELFGVSSSEPVKLRYSLHAFAEHGGLIHPNKSGWGIAYHEGKDALLIKEPEPASDSPFVRFIESQPLTSTSVIAHVRYATAGPPTFANTHPFKRELGGQMHVFAHNGSLEGIWDKVSLQSGSYRPVGDTDSEFAFCVLLERLAPLWRGAAGPPALEDRLSIFADTAAELARLGAANFLYSDGDILFVHAHKRCWDEGGGHFSKPRPPGLSLANLGELHVKGLHVEVPRSQTDVLYVASVPLTELGWTSLPEGTVAALRQGRIAAQLESRR